jgi:GNAT superfamily N-acetyltransferase
MPATPTPAQIEAIERATLEALRPAHLHAIAHWLLPFDPAEVGRARSAVPLRHDGLNLAALPALCAHYQQNGWPVVLRIADVPGLRPWQAALQAQGYQPSAAVHVQTATVHTLRQAAAHTSAPPTTRSATPDTAWSSVYTAEGFDAVDGAQRAQLLSRSAGACYATVQSGGQSLAAGVGCIGQGWLSLHGMRTVPAAQGRGLAGALIGTLADWAQAQGVGHAFLQVEADNAPALALYRRFGFQTAWTYHYWKAPASAAA